MITAKAHGGKQLCSNCNTKFYDLHRQPATCPKCEFVMAIQLKKPSTSYTDGKTARMQSRLRRIAAKRISKTSAG